MTNIDDNCRMVIDVICRKNEFICGINEIMEKWLMNILVIGNGFDLMYEFLARRFS